VVGRRRSMGIRPTAGLPTYLPTICCFSAVHAPEPGTLCSADTIFFLLGFLTVMCYIPSSCGTRRAQDSTFISSLILLLFIKSPSSIDGSLRSLRTRQRPVKGLNRECNKQRNAWAGFKQYDVNTRLIRAVLVRLDASLGVQIRNAK